MILEHVQGWIGLCICAVSLFSLWARANQSSEVLLSAGMYPSVFRIPSVSVLVPVPVFVLVFYSAYLHGVAWWPKKKMTGTRVCKSGTRSGNG